MFLHLHIQVTLPMHDFEWICANFNDSWSRKVNIWNTYNLILIFKWYQKVIYIALNRNLYQIIKMIFWKDIIELVTAFFVIMYSLQTIKSLTRRISWDLHTFVSMSHNSFWVWFFMNRFARKIKTIHLSVLYTSCSHCLVSYYFTFLQAHHVWRICKICYHENRNKY